MCSTQVLTQNDLAVLGALFDPEASLTNGKAISTVSDPINQPSPELDANAIPAHVKVAERSAIAALANQNTSAITPPSESTIHSSITSLTAITTKYPTYASAYVNRAQATRLLPDSLSDPTAVQSIFTDLATAITLATPSASTIQHIFPSNARVLASAHTHRGYLLLHASSDISFRTIIEKLNLQSIAELRPTSRSNSDSNSSSTTDFSRDLSPATLEEAASKDFAVAGRYGNKTAQTLAVKTNPYAKLCGQIVRDALQREIKEFYEGGR